MKWRTIPDRLAPKDGARWDEIKRTFGRNLLTGGAGQDEPVGRVVGQLNAFNAGLVRIGEAVAIPTLSAFHSGDTFHSGDRFISQWGQVHHFNLPTGQISR